MWLNLSFGFSMWQALTNYNNFGYLLLEIRQFFLNFFEVPTIKNLKNTSFYQFQIKILMF